MLELLKDRVYNANQDLQEQSGCEFSWISVSAIDREQGLVVMMPDGGAVTEEDMAAVVVYYRDVDSIRFVNKILEVPSNILVQNENMATSLAVLSMHLQAQMKI